MVFAGPVCPCRPTRSPLFLEVYKFGYFATKHGRPAGRSGARVRFIEVVSLLPILFWENFFFGRSFPHQFQAYRSRFPLSAKSARFEKEEIKPLDPCATRAKVFPVVNNLF